MKNVVQIFSKNFIKYFIYIAVFAQIVTGTVYLVCNFSEYIVYPETEEMIHAARTLVFDEYIGFLYPFFVRLCLNLQNICGVGYYLFVYIIQLFAMFCSAYFMVKPIFSRKKTWIVTSYIVSIPMCMQTAMMVSPFAFKAIASFLIVGSMLRLWKHSKDIWNWLVLLVSFALAAFNAPDDLFVWGVPVIVFALVNCFRKTEKIHLVKKGCILLVTMLVFVGTFVAVDTMTVEGSRGRVQKTFESVLFQRTIWPDMGVKYNFLPEEIRQCISHEEAFVSDSSAEHIVCYVAPAIERSKGTQRAKELFLEATLQQLSYNKREQLRNILRDFAGYLFTPYSVLTYMQGESGSLYGTLYSRMSALKPEMTYCYFSVFFVSIFVLTFGSIMGVLKKNILINKAIIRNIVVCGGLLVYQATWYAVVNVQGVDYRYVLLNIAVFACMALTCFKEKEENREDNKQEKETFSISKKMIGIGCIIVIGVGLLFGLTGNRLGKSYPSSNQLSEQKIVCLGDSIWGLVKEDTGIASLVEKMTGAMVDNYAIPGTTASKVDEISENDGDLWQIIRNMQTEEGNIANIRKIETSLEDAEYLILAYGLNDYFYGNEAYAETKEDLRTYEGALRNAIEYIQKKYPDVRIVLIGQNYCQFYSYGVVEADSDTRDFGGGVGMDYVKSAEKLSKEYDLLFINMYQEIPMNEWNGVKYLEDATHLNETGRKKYAKVVSEYLLSDYEERNAQ